MRLPNHFRLLFSTAFLVTVLLGSFTIPKVLGAEQSTGLSVLSSAGQSAATLIGSIDTSSGLQILGILAPTIPVYDNGLATHWQNWSWGANLNFNTSNAQVSQASYLTFAATDPWAGLYLHTDAPLPAAAYPFLRFYARSSNPDQVYTLSIRDQADAPIGTPTTFQDLGITLSPSWQFYTIPLAKLGITNQQVGSLIIQDTSGSVQPAVYFADMAFVIGMPAQSGPNPSPQGLVSPTVQATSTATTPTPTMSPSASPSGTPSTTPQAVGGTGYTTANSQIYHNGSPIVLHGVNWFGAETDTHVPHGLWARNYKDMISQMKQLGFNAVRLPVCPATLNGTAVTGLDTTKNPDLANLQSDAVLDKIINELNNQQMYILLDHHRPDCQAISDLWYTGSYSSEQWIADLQAMANRYKNLPYFLGIDLKNEPHGSATWGTDNAGTDWNTAAEQAGKAVLATDPNLVVFVEGIESQSTCSSATGHWQGGNLEPVTCTPINPSMIPANKLVYSPHVYGPDVYNQSYFSDPNFPNNMTTIWETQFGFLTGKGYTVIPGEWGGKFLDNGGDPKDPKLQTALTNYYSSKHICSSFYWDWNPNSGDTGGILQDDWQTPWQNKLDTIHNYYSTCH